MFDKRLKSGNIADAVRCRHAVVSSFECDGVDCRSVTFRGNVWIRKKS